MDLVLDLLAEAAASVEGWAERVKALPPDERRRLLLAADRARDTGTYGEGAAASCYRVLKEECLTGDGTEEARLRWIVARPASRDDTWEDLLVRVWNDRPTEDLGLEAGVIAAQLANDHEEHGLAGRRAREVLSVVRGTGRRAERLACMALAVFSLRARRDVEALVLSRRGEALSAAAGDDWSVAVARLYRSGVLRALRDWERMPAALVSVEERIPLVTRGRAARLRFTVAATRAEMAIDLGRLDEADLALDAAEALDAYRVVDVSPRLDTRVVPHLRAEVLLKRGHPADALALLDPAVVGRPWFDGVAGSIALSRVACRIALRDRDGALVEARHLLDALDREDAQRPAAGLRFDVSARLATALAVSAPNAPETRRALDLAAAAGIERVSEIVRQSLHLPELADPDPEDLAVVEAHRRRTECEQAALMQVVSRFLTPRLLTREGPLPLVRREGDLLLVCAWCQRVASESGPWLPIRRFLPLGTGLRATHGMCPSCMDRFAG